MKETQISQLKSHSKLWTAALENKAFARHDLTFKHLEIAQKKASQASLQRLVQALLREHLIDEKKLAYQGNGLCSLMLCEPLDEPLDKQRSVVFDALTRHGMNAWWVSGSIHLYRGHTLQKTLTTPSELLALLVPILDEAITDECLARISMELDDSFENDTLCVAFHQAWTLSLNRQYKGVGAGGFLSGLRFDRTRNPTLLLEQWGTTGHPWHPNYKTKLGLSTEEVLGFSPEFEAQYPVVLCALHRNMAHVELLHTVANYDCWFDSLFADAHSKWRDTLHGQGLEATDYLPLPVHPWQATVTLPDLFAEEVRDRLLVLTDIKAFSAHPTMSFRTVVPDASTTAPMVKLPVGLKLTSAQRTVSPRSACMGPRVSALLMQILRQDPDIQQSLSIVPECVGVHYLSPLPHDDRARHLSVLFRDNPLQQLQVGELAIPVGSLFALDQNGEPLLRQWVILAKGDNSADSACLFLEDYLAVAVSGLLTMYLVYGVAFEAHQQNSFMVMGEDGQPSRLLLRDFGDIRIDRRALHLQGLVLKLHDPAMTLYDDSVVVREKMLHTTFMCHLGELILLIARHWNIAEQPLWEKLGAQVRQSFDAVRARVEPQRWEAERSAVLEHAWPAKSLLRMRLHDSPTDIVRSLDNPLVHGN